VLNAGVWFGASVFFTFCVGPAIFSEDMKVLLEKFFPRYSGEIAQLLIARYFKLQLVCGVIALLHFMGENLYFGRTPQKLWLGLLAVLIALTLLGDFGLQPKMKQLHRIKYAVNSSVERREAATESFKTWHGISQMLNLLMLAGLGAHLCRVASRGEDTRFVGAGKFRS
jgi:Domain of unknown function (DUF4149)